MNIFFYTTCKSALCEHYLTQLQMLAGFKDLTVLPEGSCFKTHLALNLRSGDLIILFAANSQELEKLIELQPEYAEFRILVVLGDNDPMTIQRAHLLSPRFIACKNNNIKEIEAIAKRLVARTMEQDKI